MKKIERDVELDLLRIFAIIAVVFAHTGTSYQNLNGWNLILTYWLNVVILWHVPCFVMISGRFFLDPVRNISVLKIRKAILKIVLSFIFWNVLYQIFYVFRGDYSGLNIKGILISGALIGPYHFWYLWMLIPLYLLVPFLRQIVKNKKLTEYFIVLFLIFELLTFYGEYFPLFGQTIGIILKDADINFVLGYTGYYILGFYLYKYPLCKQKERILYIAGVVCLVGTAVFRSTISEQFDWGELVFNYLSPNIVIISASVFTFFVKHVRSVFTIDKSNSFIVNLSVSSFGVYLVHVLIINLLESTFLFTYTPLEIPLRFLRTLVVLVLSYLTVNVLKKIPCVGTWIV